jgi:hypothetical protein
MYTLVPTAGSMAGMCRCLLVLCLLAVATVAGAQDGGRVFDFDVLLDGKPVGTHRFEVTRHADGEESVRSLARFDVRFLGLTVYRYRHEARERWRGACLVELQASTDDNGTRLFVQGGADGGDFRLSAPRDGSTRSGCIAAYAYWDRARLLRKSELLNPQTGRFDAVRFEAIGVEQVEAGGAKRQAQRHRLTGDALRIDLWYDEHGEWLQLSSPARGGRELVYRRRP